MESCSCVAVCVAEVEELRLVSRKHQLRHKRRGCARMPRSSLLAPPNQRWEWSRSKRTQGSARVAAKPLCASGSLARSSKGQKAGAASGLVPGVERKLASMEGVSGRGNGEPSRGLRGSGLGSIVRQWPLPTPKGVEANEARSIDRDVRDTVRQVARGRTTPRSSSERIRLSPLSRRETQCGLVARPRRVRKDDPQVG